MSLVDSNYPLLNQYLRGRGQQENQNQNNPEETEENVGLMDTAPDEILENPENPIIPYTPDHHLAVDMNE